MNVELINPFITTTINVISTMARVRPIPGRPYVKTERGGFGDVTGLIGLTGKGRRGSFAVSFTKSCICHVVSSMFGDEISEINDDILDAVGEITNMVSGGARAELDRNGHSFEMTFPTLITGRNYDVQHRSNSPVVVVPFRTEGGEFIVEVCMTDPPTAK